VPGRLRPKALREKAVSSRRESAWCALKYSDSAAWAGEGIRVLSNTGIE